METFVLEIWMAQAGVGGWKCEPRKVDGDLHSKQRLTLEISRGALATLDCISLFWPVLTSQKDFYISACIHTAMPYYHLVSNEAGKTKSLL
jgi:hypothetical protein